MFTNIRGIYGALGVMLFLIALFLVLDKAGGATSIVRALGGEAAKVFTVLQGRNPSRIGTG